MSERITQKPTRRGFLGTAVALAGLPLAASPLAAASVAAPPVNTPSVDTTSKYRSLTPDEAAVTESVVNALCPADHLTPDGATCGLALFIDRQLDGEFGRQCAQGAWEHGQPVAYSELPLTQEQFFKAGIASVDAASHKRFGVRFSQLAAPVAAELLHDVAAGRVVDAGLPLAAWFNQLVDPLLVKACFTGPVYEAHSNRVFWKIYNG